jgi:hypothetical protein
MIENSLLTVAPDLDAYRGYAGLPPLVGLHSISEALAKGLTVEEVVSRLLRVQWSLKRLHDILVSRITAMPIYELKMAFSLHAHYCAEHRSALAARVAEMRQPPHDLEVSPDSALDLFFNEVKAAPGPEELVLGLYEMAVPAVMRAFEHLIADTNKLFDHPTYRISRFALLEIQDMREYGKHAIACLVDAHRRESLSHWLSVLDQALGAAGDLDGTQPPTLAKVEPLFSATPYPYDPVPQRDSRFKDPYNMGVNAEAMLFDPAIEARPKSIMLFFKRMREIDVPEMMASILAEASDQPRDYYCDMTRQLWDEARHAMMGELGFISLGIDWSEIPLNFTWSLGLNTKLTPLERHAVLFSIEQGLMPRRNGKEEEFQIAKDTGDRLTSLIQDYDWADEVLHARIGRKWLVKHLGSQTRAVECGDKAWSRVLVDWAKWRDAALTKHRNWWPDAYRVACRHWAIQPDPQLLAYHTTYEDTRADLKRIADGTV